MAASDGKLTVLVTGCSDGGLGAALAIAFHEAGLDVYATARDVSKMDTIASRGIQTLSLDVQSESSIADCVSRVPRLDILVNNAGAIMTMPVSDTSIQKAKELFDVNVWGNLAVTQAFLPLLLESKHRAMIVNNTSTASCSAIPFGGAYGASKAAMAMFSETMRLELEVFDINVVELKTGVVGPTNLKNNNLTLQGGKSTPILPENTIYEPARELTESAMRREGAKPMGMPPSVWAKQVVQDLLRNKPPPVIWRGQFAFMTWLASFLPFGALHGMVKKATKYNQVEEILKLARQ